MTIAAPVHRALATKVTGRSLHLVTRWGYNPWLQRVNHNSESNNDTSPSQCRPQSSRIQSIATRSYATSAAAKPVSRPKAHTGRVPAKRTTKTAAPKKPGPKTAEGKAKIGRKPAAEKTATESQAKPKSQSKSKSKPKPKPKPKTIPKKKAVKKAPSQTVLNKALVDKKKDLRAKALLATPKMLPRTPWGIIFAEAHPKGLIFAESQALTKEAAEKLKNLSPEEKEHYNHLAHINQEKNEKELQKWLSQYTPQQIKDANLARKQLAAAAKAKNPTAKSVKKYPALEDDRLVKAPQSSYILFSKHRHASGDFVRMTSPESSRLIGREWKELDAEQKKPYQDQNQADRRRYLEEYKTVYGVDPPAVKLTETTTM